MNALRTHVRIMADQGDVLLDSPYDPALIAALKERIPATARAWDGQRKVWRIAAAHGPTLVTLCQDVLGITVELPAREPDAGARAETRVIQIVYLGACKIREDGSISAMGYADGAWSVVAPEPVLRRWFEGAAIGADDPARQTLRPDTYYGLLGVPQSADAAAIKAGYRRMARQWHPDVCGEPNAHDMFLLVQGAYNILSDSILRKKYDAGLIFASTDRRGRAERRMDVPGSGYRAPLRCGLLVADATRMLGRWRLDTIHQWIDITDSAGRVMVSSWDADRERIRTEWVTP